MVIKVRRSYFMDALIYSITQKSINSSDRDGTRSGQKPLTSHSNNTAHLQKHVRNTTIVDLVHFRDIEEVESGGGDGHAISKR